jgi:hypothetical protein
VNSYFISAHEYEELKRPRAFERRVYAIGEVPREIVEAIKASKVASCMTTSTHSWMKNSTPA